MIINRYEDHRQLINKSKPFIFNFMHTKKHDNIVINWHDDLELIYCINGSGIATVSGVDYEFTKGTLIVANINELHSVFSETETDYYCILIGSDFLTDNSIDTSCVWFENRIDDGKLHELFTNLYEDYIINNLSDILKTKIDILQILHRLYKYHLNPENASQRHNTEIEKVVKYMYKNFYKDITLDKTAEMIGWSKSYLMKKFKESTGETFVEFLTKLRCNNAAVLIGEGYTISDAAYASGFNDPAFFSRTFKKKFGKNPSEIKNAHTKN